VTFARASYVSRFMTLLPGDVAITGTPKGIGPMKPGDRVEMEVEGAGILTNTVRSSLQQNGGNRQENLPYGLF
jgi:2-keto-4-pentenoate hydratase/2-oxohepta-3-ene-1,7-dioic acid hydratase in catechol pathway